MADKFASQRPLMSDPYREGFAITPNDSFSSAFTQATRALWIGSAGNVRIRMVSTYVVSNSAFAASNSNNVITLGGIPAGTKLDVCCDMVFVTGTTANGIVGLF
jgi:hypothetical protein